MTTKRLCFFVFLFLFNCTIQLGQSILEGKDFDQIDAKARKVNGNTPQLIVQRLTKFCLTDLEKVRAIFVWMTEHIAYDVEVYHKKSLYANLSADFYPVPDTLSFEEQYNERIVQYVLEKQKAICYGYALLFKKICKSAGINAVVVNGYGRTIDDNIGTPFESNHAWNVVEIEGKWYPVDVTWSSGHVNDNITNFTKSFSDYYFLTPASIFILDHYPEKKRWALLENPPELESFFNFPWVISRSRRPSFFNISPIEGKIVRSVGDTVAIEFDSHDLIKEVDIYGMDKEGAFIDTDIYINQDATQPTFEQIGNRIRAKYVVTKSKTDHLMIMVNGAMILQYQMQILP